MDCFIRNETPKDGVANAAVAVLVSVGASLVKAKSANNNAGKLIRPELDWALKTIPVGAPMDMIFPKDN